MSLICCEAPSLSRRQLLAAGGTLFGWAFLPKFAHAAGGRDPRLVVIILRGALDGLSAVGPVGDPAYAALHGKIAQEAPIGSVPTSTGRMCWKADIRALASSNRDG